jgi:hypothetical protein
VNVVSGLFTILGKELRHMRHDPLTLAVAAGMPLLQLILFGFAVQPRVERVPTAVLNHDHHARSRALVAKLQGSRMFSIRENVVNATEMQKLLRAGRVKAAIEIPEDFSANELYRRPSRLQVWVDQSEVLTALQVAAASEAAGVTESLERLVPSRLGSDTAPIVRVNVSAPNREGERTRHVGPASGDTYEWVESHRRQIARLRDGRVCGRLHSGGPHGYGLWSED